MSSRWHGQDALLRRPPSIEFPPAKKPRGPELIRGNNRFGSKGTNRCQKCQQRKGKCKFEDPEQPCDYCHARELDCGPKLPTPRKQMEQGIVGEGIGAAFVGVPFAAVPRLQIPTRFPHDGFNLSSATSPGDSTYRGSSSPEPGYTQRSYNSGLAALSPVSMGYALGRHVVESWSQPRQQPRQGWSPSATLASSPPKSPGPLPSSSATPPFCHTVQSLKLGVLPVIDAPRWHSPTPPPRRSSQEDPEFDWKFYIRTDSEKSECPSHSTVYLEDGIRRFNRILHAPRSMARRTLAGFWSHDVGVHRVGTNESIKSAPSILTAQC